MAPSTDCSAFGLATFVAQVAPQLTWAFEPMCASVRTVTTSTVPLMFTATVPATPADTPIAAMSSLFVAVTLTPRKVVLFAVMVRGPLWLGSPDGCDPCGTRLWPRPVAPPESVMSCGRSGPSGQ